MDTTNKPYEGCKIAVIGIGCIYPGADKPLTLWENILTRRRQFREMPDVRLPNSEYFDPDPQTPDKTYQNKAAVIDGYSFNWLDKRLPKQTYESTDIVHWLALDTALQAIKDAGFDKHTIPTEKTGVILGNTLTGEFTRSNQMLLRWPYVKKVLRESLRKKGLSASAGDLENVMETVYKSVFYPVTEDTLAGGLANTIAGRICNYLDLHGGGYIVDGACSSSLLAVVTAANFLELNQMDMAIVGGVDISLDTFELIGFAKTKALTPDEMRVYDKNGKGFLPGEGCGMAVLKRLEDAVKDNNEIYAILDGWGISSDGKGGITAPSVAGQSRALIRAREKAQIEAMKIDFIEGHGTGTTVGDKVELEAISIALNNSGAMPVRNCGVTSFKSIVGHTKAAAGIGAFIKTVIAVNRRILPPTAGIKDINPVFEDKALSLYPIINGKVKDPHATLFAGVSAMGFGGINSHVVMHSAGKPNEKLKPAMDEKHLLASSQSHELFLFSAPDKNALISQLEVAAQKARGMSYAELADLAFYHNTNTDINSGLRAAIVTDTPFELQRKITLLINELQQWNESGSISAENNSVVAGHKKEDVKIGAVFPGQGSQKLNMGRRLLERYPWAQSIADRAESLFAAEGSGEIMACIYKDVERAANKDELAAWQSLLKQTNIAQPAITLSSLLWYEYLKRLGLDFSVFAGHSLGELTAFYAAGLMDADTLLQFSAFRGMSMARKGSGTMASLQCTSAEAEKLIARADGYVAIANINGPQQTVISGEASAVNMIVQLAGQAQINAIELPVSAAFHSKLVAEVAGNISGYGLLKGNKHYVSAGKLISSVYGSEITGTVGLNKYFAGQAISRVDFVNAVKTMNKDCDMILEVGPGRVLSGLIGGINPELPVYPVETMPGDDLSFNVLVGNVFVAGKNINIEELYKNRLIRPFTPATEKLFLVNPLERPFAETGENASSPSLSLSRMLNMNTGSEFNSYLNDRSEFIDAMITLDYEHYRRHSITKVPPPAGWSSESPVETMVKEPVSPTRESNDEVGISTLLRARIQEMTGFDPESFTGDMRLLDDFNLDSIKAASLINGLAKTLGVLGKITASSLSNATLQEITRQFEMVIEPSGTKELKSSAPSMANSKNSIESEIFEELSARTGFPPEALSAEHKLLDDLNMDSIKAGAFISHILKKYNIQNKGNSASYSNASIGDIVNMISGTTMNAGSSDIRRESFSTPWVNAYSVQLKEESLLINEVQLSSYWSNKTLVIVYPASYADKALLLKSSMGNVAPRILTIEDKSLGLLTSSENCCFVVLVPQGSEVSACIPETVNLLSKISVCLDDKDALGFIQFNDGLFCRHSKPGQNTIASASVVSFASSLHHERPDLKIRVVEAAMEMPLEEATFMIMKEFATPEAFNAAGYDKAGIRRKMEYAPGRRDTSEITENALSEKDVIIATGGGRGITAACMLALAMKTRCKTALLGSSSPGKETEEILARYKKENLSVQYYVCDITNENAVRDSIEKIQSELGEITGILHGAGRNIPRRAEKVTREEALDEIAPKLTGFFNVSSALKDNDIKFVIALTSIIGITGMPGNSWYAFSNENLDLHIRSMQKKAGFFARTIAYSIWDEIGMGARMGSNRVLYEMGIGSIKPSLGIDEFLYWISHEGNDQQIVISSTMGSLDTWITVKPDIKANRFISDIRLFEPGRELSARVRLSTSADLYLNDHNYQGSLLFPTVFGIEAMAQAACLLSAMPDPASMVIENISLRRPVVVPPEGDIEVGLAAKVLEQDDNQNQLRIFAGIATEDSNFTEYHFSAEFVLSKQSATMVKTYSVPENTLNINAETDLYTWLLFQGPMFRHIAGVYQLDNNQAVFSIHNPHHEPSDVSFSPDVRAPLIAGSALLRDVLLQSVQLFLTKKKYLPVAIKRWEIFDIARQGNGGIVISTLNELNANSAVCDVEYISEDRIVERISGYEVKALQETPEYPDATEIASMHTMFNKTFSSEFAAYKELLDTPIYYSLFKHHVDFNKLSANERHNIEQQVFRSMIQNVPGSDTDCHITWNATGKPAVSNEALKLSVSHSRNILLITAGKEEQGCDIEFINKLSAGEWDNLLDNKFSAVIKQLTEIDGSNDVACTRLWCVKESLIKSFGQIPLNITIERVMKKGVVFRALNPNGESRLVLTFPVEFMPLNIAVIAMVVTLKGSENDKDDRAGIPNQSSALFDAKTGKFTDVFYTTFRDCRGFSGKTHFTSFIDWMGGLRELVLAPIGKELLKDLGSGEYGMVTNNSQVKVLHEADTLDEITGNIWITNRSDLAKSFIDLGFSFYKNADKRKILLADCKLSTTWVRIEGRGIVKKAPIPDYFMRFLNDHLNTFESKDHVHIKNGYPVSEDMGQIIFRDSKGLRPEFVVYENTYTTGLTHGNTVGNLYYSNYYTWQSRMIEEYFYHHVPEIMTGAGKHGEFITLHSEVNHLQEAMPFESIVVKMHISEYYENGLKLYFEYYALGKNSQRKLAYGTNVVVFCTREGENGYPSVNLLPENLVSELKSKIHNLI